MAEVLKGPGSKTDPKPKDADIGDNSGAVLKALPQKALDDFFKSGNKLGDSFDEVRATHMGAMNTLYENFASKHEIGKPIVRELFNEQRRSLKADQKARNRKPKEQDDFDRMVATIATSKELGGSFAEWAKMEEAKITERVDERAKRDAAGDGGDTEDDAD